MSENRSGRRSDIKVTVPSRLKSRLRPDPFLDGDSRTLTTTLRQETSDGLTPGVKERLTTVL